MAISGQRLGGKPIIMRQVLQAALYAAVLAAGSTGGHAQAPAVPGGITATVDQLGWIAGPWRGTLGDRTIEQHWMAPQGGSMVAMYRSIRDNRATLYELLAIEQLGNQVWLRIKHFAPGPGLVSQEGKEESANHVLVSLEGRTAVFEGATPAGPVRVTFRSPDARALTITVARQRDGKPTSTDFKYVRLTH
jgi:hypothetical protein